MGLNHLSDNEFVNHITLFHTHDLVVNRLVKILQSTALQAEFDELVRMGMNVQTCEFDYEGIDYSLSEYVRKLEREIEYRDDEMCSQQAEIKELEKTCEKLRSRGVALLISELHADLKMADQRTAEANQKLSISKVNEELATNKLKMWSYLKKDTTV